MFPTTRWTLILASQAAARPAKAALEPLCATYWKPVYFFLRRKGLAARGGRGRGPGLLPASLLERDFLPRARSRRAAASASYLRVSLEHYLVNLHEKDAALKRGGGLPVRLPRRGARRAGAARRARGPRRRPSTGVGRRPSWSGPRRLRQRIRRGQAREGRIEIVLRFFGLDEAPRYAEAAAECGMTVPQFKAALHRARARFREILREEVARHRRATTRTREREIGELRARSSRDQTTCPSAVRRARIRRGGSAVPGSASSTPTSRRRSSATASSSSRRSAAAAWVPCGTRAPPAPGPDRSR